MGFLGAAMIPKLNALTSLRFFAASTIVLQHSLGLFLPADVFEGWPLEQGVSFFFVLSGFILVYVYPELPTWRSTFRFWIARFARIWPAHGFALLLIVAISGSLGIAEGQMKQLFANILLLHAWTPQLKYYFSYNVPSWSVSTEAGFYLLFPLIIYNFRRTWWWKLIGAGGLLVAIVVACTAYEIPITGDDPSRVTVKGLIYVNPFGRLFEFVIGMCAALLWRGTLADSRPNVWLWTVVEIAIVVLVLWSMREGTWILLHYAALSPLHVGHMWTVHSGACLSFALLIIVMANGAGMIGKLLSTGLLVFLGEISYSVYLLHHVLLQAYLACRDRLDVLPNWMLFCLFLAALGVLSSAVLLLIERPARNWIRAACQKRPLQTSPQSIAMADAASLA
jgi:peptidoglycan/LPS O-acetylase OafA/YrhL